MSACESLTGDSAAGISAALRTVDCRAGEATAMAFGRLFGADGGLLQALTVLLTLYVGFYAVALLTGRARLGIAALTPRMLTLGLVLTFATSWVAYQNVVWTLAVGAPDQVASLVTGTRGSATIAFADRLDGLFTAVAELADDAAKPAEATETGITPATPMVGMFTSSTVLWLSAMLLLLGTVGVLVTAKIALAAMLALGPVFIVLALFGGTRGLFEGWLKAVVLFATVPLFAVLIGGGAVAMIDPIVRDLAMEGEQASTRAVATLFLGSAVYVALLVMALKTAGTLVAGWRLPGSRGDAASRQPAAPGVAPLAPATRIEAAAAVGDPGAAGGGAPEERVRMMLSGLAAGGGSGATTDSPSRATRVAAQVIPIHGAMPPLQPATARVQSIGNRFRARPDQLAKARIR